jgi:hypothetical protein
MDIAPKTPVAEGCPPKAGEPTGLVPGGRGARGDILNKAELRASPSTKDGRYFFRLGLGVSTQFSMNFFGPPSCSSTSAWKMAFMCS